MNIDAIFEQLLGKEGNYVDHPSDKGGPTNWGITEKTARAHGYTGDMRYLTREQALEIYRADYWRAPRFDQVYVLSPSLAEELLDTGVNMGPSVPSAWLQRWLNAFNQRGKLYPDLQADGIIGPRTISALQAYLNARGDEGATVLLSALNCSQGARYLEITERAQTQEDFIYGWMRARVATSQT
ncbi:glycoside hydrolase family 108 protein [Edwardsiella tarda]|uniref:glycoside hydrolase family 108 protein n=1 Tax=Edwardsiella tarda TaxID=636 RepID=UPI003F65F451